MTVVDSRVKKGSLTLGGEAYSCQPTNVTIAPDHEGDTEDAVEVLCGDTLVDATGTTLIANLTMTAIQDWSNPDGLVGFSWANDNVETPFEWTPTSDDQDKWAGKVVPHALTVGGDVGARITSDAEWKITELVTPPRLGSKTVIGGSGPATGATSGVPGTWTPAGATAPADAAGATSTAVVASPTTAWTTGEWVQGSTAGTGGEMHWDGAAWTAGKAP